LDQNVVARSVAKPVVNLLEIIEIKEPNLILLADDQVSLKPTFQAAPVE
jgi:hypothetical protein